MNGCCDGFDMAQTSRAFLPTQGHSLDIISLRPHLEQSSRGGFLLAERQYLVSPHLQHLTVVPVLAVAPVTVSSFYGGVVDGCTDLDDGFRPVSYKKGVGISSSRNLGRRYRGYVGFSRSFCCMLVYAG